MQGLLAEQSEARRDQGSRPTTYIITLVNLPDESPANGEQDLKDHMEIYQLTIHELQNKIKNGEVSSVQITQSVFSRIDAMEERVHS